MEQRAGLESWGMRWTEGEQLGLGDGLGSLGEVRVKLSLLQSCTPQGCWAAGLKEGRSAMRKVLAE